MGILIGYIYWIVLRVKDLTEQLEQTSSETKRMHEDVAFKENELEVSYQVFISYLKQRHLYLGFDHFCVVKVMASTAMVYIHGSH